MKTNHLALNVTITFGVADAAAQVAFQDASLDEALEQARETDKLVMVFFYSKTCNKSKFLNDTVFSDPARADSINARFVSLRIDADLPETRRYYDGYDLWGPGRDADTTMLPVPRLLFLDNAGEKTGTVAGLLVQRAKKGEQGDATFGDVVYRFDDAGMMKKIMKHAAEAQHH